MENTFVTIVISKNQIVQEFKSEKEGETKSYSKIITADGYTYIRPTEQIKISDENENKRYFNLPEDYTVKLQKSIRDDNEETGYRIEVKEISAVGLKEKYENVTNINNEDWIVITITKKQVVGRFNYQKRNEIIEMARIITPEGSTFLRAASQLREVNDNANNMQFSIKKDNTIIVEKINKDIIDDVTEEGKNIYHKEKYSLSAEELRDMMNNKRNIEETVAKHR